MQKDNKRTKKGRRGKVLKRVKVGVLEDGKGVGREVNKICLKFRMETVISV